MAYLQTELGQLIPDLQQDLLETATENQTQNRTDITNTVEVALSAALENGTLVAIATTVLQDALHFEKFLTALSTALTA